MLPNADGVPYRMVDIAISGRAAGCLVDDVGPRTRFVDAPNIWLSQLDARTTEHLPVRRGAAAFDAADGSGMTVLYPESEAAWNGKLWIVQHGKIGRASCRERVK